MNEPKSPLSLSLSSSLPDITLPADYYLTNFVKLIDIIEQRDNDLLLEGERDWLARFKLLNRNGKCLLVRLLMRNGEWFKRDKLSYDEIGLERAINDLAKFGFICEVDKPPIDVVLLLATKSELPAIFPSIVLAKSASKPRWISAVLEWSTSFAIPSVDYPLIQLCDGDYLTTFMLLFFGNSRQSLTQFVLDDLGVERFEQYTLSLDARLFHQRLHIDAWLQLSALQDQYWQFETEKNKQGIVSLAASLPTHFEWPPLERKRAKLLNAIAREMERQGEFDRALSLFEQTDAVPSRERRCRITLKLLAQASASLIGELYDRISHVLCSMLLSPNNADEYEVALRILKPLEKKHPPLFRLIESDYSNRVASDASIAETPVPERQRLRIELNPKPLRTQTWQLKDLIGAESSERIERIVAQEYEAQGWVVWFSENRLLTGLFGLAFWDVIFSHQPEAFINPYQRAPYDMYSPEFIERRSGLIAKRLTEIETGDYLFMDVYEQKCGIANDWIHWQSFDKSLLLESLRVIPAELLCATFRWILQDLRNNRTGMPDLFMCRNDEWQWVEVKGLGDKLQNNQRRWCHWFEDNEVPYHILYVEDKKQ